jgi:hypothetical protein
MGLSAFRSPLSAGGSAKGAGEVDPDFDLDTARTIL